MKNIALTFALALAAPAFAAPSVGISIGIQQPGVYGRIDIGSYPQPELVYAEPVLISPSRVAAYQRPIYLYVPVADQRDWRHHCRRYNACGQPVYFVKEQWVRDRYHQEHEGPPRGDRRDGPPGRGNGRGH